MRCILYDCTPMKERQSRWFGLYIPAPRGVAVFFCTSFLRVGSQCEVTNAVREDCMYEIATSSAADALARAVLKGKTSQTAALCVCAVMRLPPPEHVLSRRSALVASCWLAALSTSPPSSLAAAPPTACAPSDLLSAQAALERVEKLLPQRTDWPEAAKLLASIDATSMGKALDACVDPKSFKEQAMNNAAFIVYYEEARYKDTRLEPQTPSLRAEQNGRKKEFLRALEDTTLELQFLTSHPEESDVSELRRFAATASGALRDFVSLLPKGADGGS